jgi:hypothetical protein
MFDSDLDTVGSVVMCTSAGWKDIDDDGASETNTLTTMTGVVDFQVPIGASNDVGAYIALAECNADQMTKFTNGAPNTVTCVDIAGLTDADVASALTIDHSTSGTLTLDADDPTTNEGQLGWDAAGNVLRIGEAGGTDYAAQGDSTGKALLVVDAVCGTGLTPNSGVCDLTNDFGSAIDLNGAEVNSTLTYDHGGTDQTSYAQGDLLYASAANTLGKLTVGTATQVLLGSATVPVYGTVPSGAYTAQSIDGDDVATTIAGRSLTMDTAATPDEIDADVELYTEEESWVIYSGVATAGDELLVHTNAAITLVSLDCVVTGATTPTVTVNIVECTNAGATCANSGLTVSPAATTTLYTDDTPTDAAIDANDWWGLDMTTLTTEGDIMHCTVEYTRDD